MRAHEEASGTKHVPKKLMDEWAKKDPLQNYANFLLSEKLIDQKQVDNILKKLKKEIEAGLAEAFQETLPVPDTEVELNDVYAPFNQSVIAPPTALSSEKRLIDLP